MKVNKDCCDVIIIGPSKTKDAYAQYLNPCFPEFWYSMNGNYDAAKEQAEDFIVKVLRDKLPGFADAQINVIHTATPVTWESWVYRKKGRVCGILQSMARSLLNTKLR